MNEDNLGDITSVLYTDGNENKRQNEGEDDQ